MSTLNNGLGIIHSNHLETLADAYIAWCQKTPLAPLEQEVVLVQSGGMGDWLKLRQAQQLGISASTRFLRPSRFLWDIYQTICPSHASPYYQTDVLQWRIYRLLPALCQQESFQRPRHFIFKNGEIDAQHHFQLSKKLATLFQQYLLYRSDWLCDWELGKSVIQHEDERWQMQLWQSLSQETALSDAHLFEQFKQHLAAQSARLPRRIIVFGINSLAKQVLDSLYQLVPYCQVLLLVLDPCQSFWQDKSALENPLLDSWGARGRDFIRLLNEQYDNTEQHLKLNIWQAEAYLQHTDTADKTLNVLQQVQSAISQNQLAPEPCVFCPSDPPSIGFYPAYSRQREVEVLHDRLLTLFSQDETLSYHDVIVMLPDVGRYSAHIEAVFKQYPKHDKRHLDFAISDQNAIQQSSFHQCLTFLLHLPDKRISQSEVLFLLEQEALQARWGIDQDQLDTIRLWCEKSYIRWGIDSQHKAALLNEPADTVWQNNTWQQGLDKLLAGYCAGTNAVWPDQAVALDEVSANQGELLGKLQQLIQTLAFYQQNLQQTRNIQQWLAVFTQLIGDFFAAKDSQNQAILEQVQNALKRFADNCQLAQMTDTVPLATARQGFLDAIGSNDGLHLRFNGIVFCTLMPMRALPFKHIFLLGMNDGDYPREQISPDFDLMQPTPHQSSNARVGDLDRRADDQYLFLEALLSARESLSISWLGKSINDGQEKQASSLVNQLKSYLDSHWKNDTTPVSEQLSREYPLAAFSEDYFLDSACRKPWHQTYAQQWRALYQNDPASTALNIEAPSPLALSLEQLINFLKQPVSSFFYDTLKVRFALMQQATDNDEPFAINALDEWQLRQAFLSSDNPSQQKQQLLASGQLPAGFASQTALDAAEQAASSIANRFQDTIADKQKAAPQTIRLQLNQGTLDGVIDALYQDNQGQYLQASYSASNLGKNADKLIAPWLKHLALCANGIEAPSHIIALDRSLHFSAIKQSEALHQLNQLCDYYRQSLAAPLPITAKAAWAYLHAAANDHEQQSLYQAAKAAFSSGDYYQGDDNNIYVSRCFDDFDRLWQNDGQSFGQLAKALYQGLFDAIAP